MTDKSQHNGASVGKRLERAFLHLVRAYTYNTPIPRGKYRIYTAALNLCRYKHDSLHGQAKDGRNFWINLSTGMHEKVFFVGEFERTATEVVRRLVRKGDVCIDVGANFGWYTTLFAANIGPDGAVHTFEPVPDTFRELKRNYELLANRDNVFLNNCALGDEEGSITLNLFSDLPTGHASVSSQGRDADITFECRLTKLDTYLESHSVGQVDFVKVDIEGAEMMFLKGADKLFEQERPPAFLMEMALNQTRHFGYTPDDLVQYLAARGEYNFYSIDDNRQLLIPITGFAPDDIGANVVCVPTYRGTGAIRDMIEKL